MIRQATLQRQLIRLSVLAHRDQDETADEVWAEDIESALTANARDDARLVEIVDCWVRQSRWRPAAADIHGIGRDLSEQALADRGAEVQRDRRCGACGGTGWEVGYRLTTYEGMDRGYSNKRVAAITAEQYADLRAKVDGLTQRVDSGVMRCTRCDYGRHMAVLAQAASQDDESRPRATRRRNAEFVHSGDIEWQKEATGE